jgi:murein DD-endopeptidase MepM/ murein hydrolase activator NlpD
VRLSAAKKTVSLVCLILTVLILTETDPSAARALTEPAGSAAEPSASAEPTPKKDLIRWVDFKVPCEAMKKAISLDILTRDKDVRLDWIEMLAYLAAKNGNNFKGYKDKQLDELAEKLISGTTMAELTETMKYYGYYLEAYKAALGGFVGDYELEVPDEDGQGKHWEQRYGIKVFSPIAKNFPYSHCHDFGNRRAYGFSRTHLGNDLMGQVGTPVIAVEGGVVEALGWNQYGGWRIGIRSHDRKRYYYYAHLRKNFPYRKDLEVGSIVESGDVIGYLGRTGYSIKENVNNLKTSHLHFGMQLIFDESQKECLSEIWIDVYEIVRLLDNKRSEVVKNPETKDYYRVYDYRDASQSVGE